MNGVIEIEDHAFAGCYALSNVEFDKLEITGRGSLCFCESLRSINLPSIRRILPRAFFYCTALTDVVFGEEMEGIEERAFRECTSLRRIAIPLKDNLIIKNGAFNSCDNLVRVDIVGVELHKTISSLHMESWRNEMKEEIERINQTLPDTQSEEKGAAINQWIESVLHRMEHFQNRAQSASKGGHDSP